MLFSSLMWILTFLLQACVEPNTEKTPSQPEDPLVVVPPIDTLHSDSLTVDTEMMQVMNTMLENMRTVKMYGVMF